MNKKRTVLVIDDDQGVRDLFVRTLGLKGFEVISSATADEAVDWAKEVEPDLIFISLLLPGSNGLKVSKAIHAQETLKGIPVVMLTSYQGELDPKYTSTIGIIDVLVKPLNANAILEKTVRIIGEGSSAPAAVEEEEDFAPAFQMPAEEPSKKKKETEEMSFSGNSAFDDYEPGSEDIWHEEALREEEASPAPANAPAPAAAPGPKPKPQAGGVADDFMDFESEIDDDKEAPLAKAEKNPEPKLVVTQTPEEMPPVPEYEELEPEEKKKDSKKTILVIAAAVLVVAGITFAAFSFKDFIFPAKKQIAKQTAPKAAAKPAPAPASAPAAAPAPTPSAATETAAQQKNAPAAAASNKAAAQAPAQAAVKPEPAKPAAPAQKTEPPKPAVSAQKPEPPKQKPEPAKAPEKPVAAKQAAPPAKASAAAAPALKPVKAEPAPTQKGAGKTFAVQAGFFSDKRNAASLVEKLNKKGHEAYVQEDQMKKGSRVLVGKFSTRKEALSEMDALKSEGVKGIVLAY